MISFFLMRNYRRLSTCLLSGCIYFPYSFHSLFMPFPLFIRFHLFIPHLVHPFPYVHSTPPSFHSLFIPPLVHSFPLFIPPHSYGSGTRPWNRGSGIDQATDDGIIEVIGLTTYQMVSSLPVCVGKEIGVTVTLHVCTWNSWVY